MTVNPFTGDSNRQCKAPRLEMIIISYKALYTSKLLNINMTPSLDPLQCQTYIAQFQLPGEHSLPKAAYDTIS